MPHDLPDESDNVDPGFTDDSATSKAPGAAEVPATLDEDQLPFEPPATITESSPEEDLRRHAEMLERLVADHPGSGVLVLQGRDADPQTGQERLLAMPFEDAALVNGVKHIRTQSRRIAGQIVDAADELAEYAPYHHLYAPLAIMDEALLAGRAGAEADIVGVLGLVAYFEGGADYEERLPLEPDYVLACGDEVQACYLLESRRWSPRPNLWPWSCSSRPGATPPPPLIWPTAGGSRARSGMPRTAANPSR